MTSRIASPFIAAAAAAIVLLASPASTRAQSTATRPAPRIAAASIDNSSRATLAGTLNPHLREATDLGAVPSSQPLPGITMVFSRSAAQQADLTALLAAQQNPASPLYHQWLTPAEFGARFGLADSDLAKVEAWLQSQGFTVDSVSPSRDHIAFSGTAGLVASAFGAPVHQYRVGTETHFAPSTELSLPTALSGVVADVRNLSDFRPHAQVRYGNGAAFKPSFTSAFTSSETGNHYLTPKDVAVIYDINAAYNAGYNGAGQNIAIVGQSLVSTTDITNFQTAIGDTAKAPTLMLVPNSGSSEAFSGDESESDLDLEYSSGIAPGANVYFVYVGNSSNYSVFDALTFAITNRIASIINISYGECEALLGQASYTSLNSTLAQAAAQGQTVIAAAGDNGSTDCYDPNPRDRVPASTSESLAVDFPGSSQYVTSMGGTEFPAADVATGNNTYFAAATSTDVVTSALSYIPEQVWNDDSSEYGLSAGGGGVSMYTALPSWQTGVPGIPSGSNRFVPDIALDASPENAPYAYCTSDTSGWATGQDASCNSGLRDSTSQDLTVAGGTSFAAPIFSGMLALINQAKGYTAQGVVNPTLYSLASNATTYSTAFHDITSGGNNCTAGSTYCSGSSITLYPATPGYDEASGLGSVDLDNLLTAWPQSTSSGGGTTTTPTFTLSASPSSLSLTSGTSGSSTITANAVNGYADPITWSVLPSQSVSGACYSLTPAAASGTTPASATLNISTGNTTCPSGTTALVAPGSASGSSRAQLQPPARHNGRAAESVTFAGLGVLALALAGFRSRRRLPVLLAILLLGFAGFGLSGCGESSGSSINNNGGGTTQPTTSNYTITVIGTDTSNNAITAQTTIALSITTNPA